MNPEIQILLNRKYKADSLPREIRNQYAREYNWIVDELVKYAFVYQLPLWDEEVNSKILLIILLELAREYEIPELRPAVDWILYEFEPEVNESFRMKDQARFFRCVQITRQRIESLRKVVEIS